MKKFLNFLKVEKGQESQYIVPESAWVDDLITAKYSFKKNITQHIYIYIYILHLFKTPSPSWSPLSMVIRHKKKTYSHVWIGNTWGHQWWAWSDIAKKKKKKGLREWSSQFRWEEKKAVSEYEKMATEPNKGFSFSFLNGPFCWKFCLFCWATLVIVWAKIIFVINVIHKITQ